MSEINGIPVSPLEDQLGAARRFHAEAFADYLENPSRPTRLVLVDALRSHEQALAEYHGVGIGELAILPEEQVAYTSQFIASSAEKDERETSIGRRIARIFTLMGAAGHFTDKISSGDLYFNKTDLIAISIGVYAIFGESNEDEPDERVASATSYPWLIEDPFKLTNEVLASAGQYGFSLSRDKKNGKMRFVDNNLRRRVRRQLLSRRRRAISTFAGQL